MGRPVCCKCGREMQCVKNEVNAIEKYMDNFSRPYRIWGSDRYQCPVCGVTILTGFGQDAFMYENDEGFYDELDRIKRKEEYLEYY